MKQRLNFVVPPDTTLRGRFPVKSGSITIGSNRTTAEQNAAYAKQYVDQMAKFLRLPAGSVTFTLTDVVEEVS